jgi:Ca2+-binding EF-hand superfamily protein
MASKKTVSFQNFAFRLIGIYSEISEFKEFVLLVQQMNPLGVVDETDIRDTFKRADKNKNGKIDANEVIDLVKTILPLIFKAK